MTVTIKTPDDIEKMRIAGRLAAEVLEMIGEHIKPGVTTEELDRICHDYIVNEQKAIPAPLNYKGLSQVDLHLDQPCGLPWHPQREAAEGKATSSTSTSPSSRTATTATPARCSWSARPRNGPTASARSPRNACTRAFPWCVRSAHLGDIGEIVQKHAEKNGFSVVREYCGHGIGKVFHEEPQVLHYGRAGTGIELKEGMIFTIRPMINQGRPETRLLGDGWTAITRTASCPRNGEHTVLVTADGYEILTLRNDETFPRTSAA